jgi:L-fuculose-phosphate aldolase
LSNHGQIAFGPTLGKALALAVEVESLCDTYLRALAVGEPVRLTEAEMAEVIAKFATYGASAPRRQRGSSAQR